VKSPFTALRALLYITAKSDIGSVFSSIIQIILIPKPTARRRIKNDLVDKKRLTRYENRAIRRVVNTIPPANNSFTGTFAFISRNE
jgi:hypothetical protein